MQQHVWTRTDDAHASKEYIDELWQLINIGATHKVAELEFSWVVFCRLHLVCIAVDVHRPELETVEFRTVQSVTFLFEDDGAGTLSFYNQSDDQVDYREDCQQEDARYDNVESSFDSPVPYVL